MDDARPWLEPVPKLYVSKADWHRIKAHFKWTDEQMAEAFVIYSAAPSVDRLTATRRLRPR